MVDFQKRLFIFIYCDTETLRLVKICCRIFDPAIYNYFFIKSLQYAGFDHIILIIHTIGISKLTYTYSVISYEIGAILIVSYFLKVQQLD
jgi:hypothetical protein